MHNLAMSEEKPGEELLAKELVEANESAGVTKWYPFIHFPKARSNGDEDDPPSDATERGYIYGRS